MPELPDVELLKKYLDATSLHKKIKDVEIESSKILEGVSRTDLKEALAGSIMKSTRRHGKYLFVKLKRSLWLVLHFGMTGALSYFKHKDNTPKYARMTLTFSNGYRLSYISMRLLGKVGLAEGPDEYIEKKGLGPDALTIGLPELQDIFSGRRGMVKSTIMNQRLMAGVGNVYSDEALFHCGIHPKKPAGELSGKDVKELHRQMKRVLKLAVKHKADPDKMPSGWILPLRGRGGKCPRCGTELESAKVSGRTTWYCPQCQKMRD